MAHGSHCVEEAEVFVFLCIATATALPQPSKAPNTSAPASIVAAINGRRRPVARRRPGAGAPPPDARAADVGASGRPAAAAARADARAQPHHAPGRPRPPPRRRRALRPALAAARVRRAAGRPEDVTPSQHQALQASCAFSIVHVMRCHAVRRCARSHVVTPADLRPHEEAAELELHAYPDSIVGERGGACRRFILQSELAAHAVRMHALDRSLGRACCWAHSTGGRAIRRSPPPGPSPPPRPPRTHTRPSAPSVVCPWRGSAVQSPDGGTM